MNRVLELSDSNLYYDSKCYFKTYQDPNPFNLQDLCFHILFSLTTSTAFVFVPGANGTQIFWSFLHRIIILILSTHPASWNTTNPTITLDFPHPKQEEIYVDRHMYVHFLPRNATNHFRRSSWAAPPLILCLCVLWNPGFSPALCARKKWVPCRKRECSVPLCISPSSPVDKRMIILPC